MIKKLWVMFLLFCVVSTLAIPKRVVLICDELKGLDWIICNLKSFFKLLPTYWIEKPKPRDTWTGDKTFTYDCPETINLDDGKHEVHHCTYVADSNYGGAFYWSGKCRADAGESTDCTGHCPSGYTCDAQFIIYAYYETIGGDGGGEPSPVCGNGACESGESVINCPQDCPGVCGDGICNDYWEDKNNCPEDCGYPETTTTTTLPPTTSEEEEEEEEEKEKIELKPEIREIAWYQGDTKILDQGKILEGSDVSVLVKIKFNKNITKFEGFSGQVIEDDQFPEPDDVWQIEIPVKEVPKTGFITLKGDWKAWHIEDGWFGWTGSADWRFEIWYQGKKLASTTIFKVDNDKSKLPPSDWNVFKWSIETEEVSNPSEVDEIDAGETGIINAPTPSDVEPFKLKSWGFYVGKEKRQQLFEGEEFTAKVVLDSYVSGSGTLRIGVYKDNWFTPDTLIFENEKEVSFDVGDELEISVDGVAKQANWAHDTTYHLAVWMDDEKIIDRLPKNRNDDIRIVKGEVAIKDYGWVKGSDNTPIEESEVDEQIKAIAYYTLSGGKKEGRVKINIKRHKALWLDPNVKSCSLDVILTADRDFGYVCKFVPEEPGKYHFEVYWNNEKLVDRSDTVCVKSGLLGCETPLDFISNIFSGTWMYLLIFGVIVVIVLVASFYFLIYLNMLMNLVRGFK